MKKVFAIDPGTFESGYVVVFIDDDHSVKIIEHGKLKNEDILEMLPMHGASVVIEMIACYGMPVGREVFETCLWIGRFLEKAGITQEEQVNHFVYRIEEKQVLCHNVRANDANIVQALVDRYAYGQPNKGKGTKKNPGTFYGFSKDSWQAMAVAVTWMERENL